MNPPLPPEILCYIFEITTFSVHDLVKWSDDPKLSPFLQKINMIYEIPTYDDLLKLPQIKFIKYPDFDMIIERSSSIFKIRAVQLDSSIFLEIGPTWMKYIEYRKKNYHPKCLVFKIFEAWYNVHKPISVWVDLGDQEDKYYNYYEYKFSKDVVFAPNTLKITCTSDDFTDGNFILNSRVKRILMTNDAYLFYVYMYAEDLFGGKQNEYVEEFLVPMHYYEELKTICYNFPNLKKVALLIEPLEYSEEDGNTDISSINEFLLEHKLSAYVITEKILPPNETMTFITPKEWEGMLNNPFKLSI